MNNKADLLKAQVPDFVSGTTIMNDIYNAHGKELDLLVEYNQDILNQLFVETATWGLSYWEEFFGLPVLINQDINIRRAKIRAHFASFGTVNKATIKRIANDFGFKDVDIIEDYAPYIVKLIFDNSASSDVININDLITTLRRMCPAHVDFMYVFLYKSWKDIQDSNMSFDMLEKYQWKDYTIDFDTSSTVSPYLKLKLWEDGDLFSMLGFNYNFDKIDSYYQRHTHDGIDSPKIKCTNIKYQNNEINDSLTNAIKRLNTKIKASDKENTKARWGYPTNMPNRWADITQYCYDTNLALVAAIRRKGVDIPDGTPFNRLSLYIDNIFTGLTPQGSAIPKHVREGKTFINANGVQTGTATYRTGTITPSTQDIDISGYADNLILKGDSNLKATNIKSGTALWNVRGTLSDADYINGSIIQDSNITSAGKRDAVKWMNTNRRNEVLCMDASDYIMLGGDDLRIYDKETGQPYRIFTKQMLLKVAGYDTSSNKNNMKVTHITRTNMFIFQDTVNKDLCCLMELDNSYRNIKLLKTYKDYAVALEKSYGGNVVIGFKKSIITRIGSNESKCTLYGTDELIPNGVRYSNGGNGNLYYITKNPSTKATTLHYNFKDGSGPMWSKTIAELLPNLTKPEATCLEYDIKSNSVLVGVNDKLKLNTSGGTLIDSNYAHIIIVDATGSLIKDVDFSNNKVVNPDLSTQKYALRGITHINRQCDITNLSGDEKYTATFLDNPDSEYSVFDSIEIDRSINILRHINELHNSYKNVTQGMYVGDSLYAVMYCRDNYTGMYNLPILARIQRTPETYTITK